MKSKIEGILLSKVDYQDRHSIGKILLRTGEKISCLFYGGKGGGKKQKGSMLELGYFLEIELSRSKASSELYQAKEVLIKWSHEHIRKDYKAFYAMCLFLESSQKLALDANLHEEVQVESRGEGAFKTLSNALFRLEAQCKNKTINVNDEIFIFVSKLIVDQGICPDLKTCLFCGLGLDKCQQIKLVFDQGGFACSDCTENTHEKLKLQSLGKNIWHAFALTAVGQYQKIDKFDFESITPAMTLFDYLCHQYQLDKNSFRSLSTLI